MDIDRTEITRVQAFEGSSNSLSFGAGLKFYISQGLGARMLLDYYSRTEDYVVDGSSSSFSRTTSGIRFMAGFGYRW